MHQKSDFTFMRMWPREVLQVKKGKGLAAHSVQVLKKPGVYILYCGSEPHYIGKAERLFKRLHDHANKMTDRYYPLWDFFSCFALTSQDKKGSSKLSVEEKRRLSDIEGILIAAIPLAMNGASPHYKIDTIPLDIRTLIRKANDPKTMSAKAGS